MVTRGTRIMVMAILVISAIAATPYPAHADRVKPRVIATTDGELDDRSSMVRFLMYTSDYDVAGIIQVNSSFQPSGHSSEHWIEALIAKYDQCLPNLRQHRPDYPDASYLLSVLKVGNENSTDLNKYPYQIADSIGAQHIISVLLDSDPRPVHILAWGGANTQANALWQIKTYYSATEYQWAASKARLYCIWFQDAGGSWIKNNLPEVKIYGAGEPGRNDDSWRYVWDYMSVDYKWKNRLSANPPEIQTIMDTPWLTANVKSGHGPLGAAYPQTWTSEGDTPSFMPLIDNGLDHHEDYTLGGWGGRAVYVSGNYMEDGADDNAGVADEHYTFWRWLPAVQNDWASRADWCVTTTYAGANHQPVATVVGGLKREVATGQTVTLDATGTDDPDGDDLTYKWWQYYEADSATVRVTINNSTSMNNASFVVPSGQIGKQIHVMLEVTDDGTPPLVRYRRVICNVAAVIDTMPPTPDPMTWATAPYGANETSVAMVATTATDNSGVEYFFDCTAGGGHDSGWQNSASYTDSGLALGVIYSYQVKARDKSTNHNETGFSSVASASPVTDTTAPAPNPMTWASAPAATGIDTITMTATTATDASGVEYFFACTAGGGHDSGWQNGATYTDTGLTNNTTYTYRVIARDKSTGQNETGWSQEASATTPRYECTAPIENDFNGDCKVDFMDYAAFASNWGAESGTAVNLVTNGGFTTSISSWTLADVSGASGVMTAAFDGSAGNPAGSALMSVEATVQTNNHRFYQCVPVIVGHEYLLTGEWSGDIRGLVTDGSGGTLRNWAEVHIGFETSTTPANWTSMSIMYKKAYGAGLQNTTTGVWGWEAFSDSPNGTTPPAGGIFTATAPYMVIAFNLGGRAGSGNTHINADNISVVETGGALCPEMDLNGDCALDWLDIQVFAADWLACNRNPGSECLE